MNDAGPIPADRQYRSVPALILYCSSTCLVWSSSSADTNPPNSRFGITNHIGYAGLVLVVLARLVKLNRLALRIWERVAPKSGFGGASAKNGNLGGGRRRI